MLDRLEQLRRIRSTMAGGRPEIAAAECAELLQHFPGDVEARYLQGRCHGALGRWPEAAAEFRTALSYQPSLHPAMVDLGIAQAFAGKFTESHQILEQARAIDARPAELHFGLGLCALGTGEFTVAEDSFRAALTRNPRLVDAHNNLGVVLDRLGRLEDAIACFRQATVLRPNYAMAQRNLADGLLRLGQAAQAATAFAALVALCPTDPLAHADLGTARLAAGDFGAAVQALEQALSLDPRLYDAAANLGEALRNLNSLDPAGAAFRRALLIKSDCAEAYLGLAKVAVTQGRRDEAADNLLAAVHCKPSDPATALLAARLLEDLGRQAQAVTLLGDAAARIPANADIQDAQGELLHRFGKLQDALVCYRRALALEPGRAQTHLNLGRTLESLGRIDEAITSIETALRIRPTAEALASLASCAFRICDWELASTSLARLRDTPSGIDLLHPFLMIAADLEPHELSLALRRKGRLLASTLRSAPRRFAHQRLRVAYFSPDFREHPVAHAIAGVIEKHDRERFTPIGVALSTPGASKIGQRLREAFDEFIDASSLSDDAVTELMNQREIDIAIDLAGHTAGARPQIFARGAGSIQVNYLGFPSSMGVDFMDVIIADSVVVAQSDEPLYTERVLRMPYSYLPFDGSRPPVNAAIPRSAAGLPPEGFVFCAFNNGYKISRAVFEVWMTLLREVPQSVLWLRSMGTEAATQLQTAAAGWGIDAGRLIFAPFVDTIEAHLARLRCADLFLDTQPYNAHTTAAEALWCGVPVVTCPGRIFASRVGASVLRAAGLEQWVCRDLDGYRDAALELARTPALLRDWREKVDRARGSAPLFDTPGYTRDFENLLATAWQHGYGQ